jgi:hypothetical protein
MAIICQNLFVKIFHFVCNGAQSSYLMICNISNVQKVYRNNCVGSGHFVCSQHTEPM